MTTEHVGQRPGERIIETEWEIGAPVADVWRALTDAEWLTNWFPTDARITPGKGGTIWTAWTGMNEEFSATIAEWDEHRRLKLVYAEPTPPEDADAARARGEFFPFQIAADYHLEARGDATILRLVHSGFAEDSSWDWQYHATSRGWRFELGGLKHFLERHKGVPRFVVQARHVLADVAFDVAWQIIFGSNGLAGPGSTDVLREGDKYVLRTAAGDEFQGVVEIFNPPHDFAATVENLNGARLRIKIDQSCAEPGQDDVIFFLSTYGVPKQTNDALQDRMQSMLDDLFGAMMKSQ